jgi:hypothetical protein
MWPEPLQFVHVILEHHQRQNHSFRPNLLEASLNDEVLHEVLSGSRQLAACMACAHAPAYTSHLMHCHLRSDLSLIYIPMPSSLRIKLAVLPGTWLVLASTMETKAILPRCYILPAGQR